MPDLNLDILVSEHAALNNRSCHLDAMGEDVYSSLHGVFSTEVPRVSSNVSLSFKKDGTVISANQGWCDLFDVDADQVTNSSLFKILQFDVHDKLIMTLDRLLQGAPTTIGEFRHVDRRGQVHWYAWSVHYDVGADCFYATGVDIGRRRRQHEIFETITQRVSSKTGKALLEAIATQLAGAFSMDRVGVSRLDGDHFETIAYADQNGKLQDIRYPVAGSACEQSIRGGRVRISINPSGGIPAEWGVNRGKCLAYIACPIYTLDRLKIVGLIWIVSLTPVADVALLEWLLLSFSVRIAAELERVSREEELERQLAYNRAILKASPDLLFVLSPDFVYQDFFCRSADQLIVPPEQIIGRKMADLLPVDICKSFIEAHENASTSGEVSSFSYQLDILSGERRSFEARVLASPDGSSLQFVRDITPEQDLRGEQRRLTSILEASPDICAIVGYDGKLQYLNPAGRRFFGFAEAEISDPHWFHQIKPAWAVNLFMSTGVPSALRDGIWRGDTTYTDIKGRDTPFSQLIVAHPTAGDQQGGYYSVVLRDVSDRRKFESKIEEQQSQIMSSAKMAALGEMAAGIAHEINNPLASIMARAQVLGEMAHERPAMALDRMCEFTDKISQMAERIARIIRSLRFFARDGDMDPLEKRMLQELIDETLELCRARFRSHNVRLEVELFDASLTVMSRPVQLSQVLLNLLSNAFDAVTLLDERWVKVAAVEQSDWLELSVTDSGRGIDELIASKIMLPFFTTKEVGSGTGLGLSISSGIVQSHGGELFLDKESKNTRFVVRLPKISRSSPTVDRSTAETESTSNLKSEKK